MLRIATFNVNGIRASHQRGFAAWNERALPDVVALQEVRCPVESLPPDAWCGLHAAYDPGTLAGRNGVAVLSRVPPADVRTGIGDREFASEGRYLEVDLDLPEAPLTVASLYLPKGSTRASDPAKYQRKQRFMASFTRHLTKARRDARRRGREFLVMGDFNVAHTTLDVTNWRANQRNEGFLPEERAWFGEQLGPRTLVDVVRTLHPGTAGPNSWWRWGGRTFEDDTGWRIDYHLASPGLASRAVAAWTDRPTSSGDRLSDHAPVLVDYAF